MRSPPRGMNGGAGCRARGKDPRDLQMGTHEVPGKWGGGGEASPWRGDVPGNNWGLGTVCRWKGTLFHIHLSLSQSSHSQLRFVKVPKKQCMFQEPDIRIDMSLQ